VYAPLVLGAMLRANAGRSIVLNEDQMERVAAFANLSSGFDGGVSMQVAHSTNPKGTV
jgi:hypothetical protein